MSNAKEFTEIIALLGVLDTMCEKLWQTHHRKCELRREPKDPDHGEVAICGYPERINYINVDNCKYRWCPLVKKARR